MGASSASTRWQRWLVLPLLLVACSSGKQADQSTGRPKSIPALKLIVLSAVGGKLAYCDPDQYPVAHGSPLESARERFPMIEADQAVFQAILQHEHLSSGNQFTPAQLIAINDEYKQIQAIQLVAEGDRFRFTVLVRKSGTENDIESVGGTVSRSGSIDIERRGPGQPPNCPICLAAGVRIASPFGEIPVQDLRVGMLVWTTDRHGRRIAGAVRSTGRMQAPLGHEVIRLALADGRSVLASPGHPTADGRTVGDLRTGDTFDGSRVVAATPTAYGGATTYDLLPSGPTGTYFASGVLLGSSLSTPASRSVGSYRAPART